MGLIAIAGRLGLALFFRSTGAVELRVYATVGATRCGDSQHEQRPKRSQPLLEKSLAEFFDVCTVF